MFTRRYCLICIKPKMAKQELKARVSDLAVALGEKLLPMATAMVKKAVEIVEKMTAWVEAHPKLVEWIAKLAFTLGIIAAVGGPILMAAAAFARVKTVVDSVTFALKLLNIRMGIHIFRNLF